MELKVRYPGQAAYEFEVQARAGRSKQASGVRKGKSSSYDDDDDMTFPDSYRFILMILLSWIESSEDFLFAFILVRLS